MTHYLFLILATLVAHCIVSVYSWHPIGYEQIPRANATDRVLVSVLQAPLLYDKLGPALGYANLYHLGLGFHNLNTGAKWQLEFDALPSFTGAIIPEIQKINGTREVSWDNYGGTVQYLGINNTYWHVNQFNVAEVTGAEHNLYVTDYLRDFNKTRGYYDLFVVMDHFPNGKEFLPGFTCMDFVWDSLDWMIQTFGAKLDYSHRIKRNIMVMHTDHEPINVDYKGPHHNEILDHFELLSGKFKDLGVIRFILKLTDILAGKIYLRLARSEEYYMLQLKWPFVSAKYVEVDLPRPRQKGEAPKYTFYEEPMLDAQPPKME